MGVVLTYVDIEPHKLAAKGIPGSSVGPNQENTSNRGWEKMMKPPPSFYSRTIDF